MKTKFHQIEAVKLHHDTPWYDEIVKTLNEVQSTISEIFGFGDFLCDGDQCPIGSNWLVDCMEVLEEKAPYSYDHNNSTKLLKDIVAVLVPRYKNGEFKRIRDFYNAYAKACAKNDCVRFEMKPDFDDISKAMRITLIGIMEMMIFQYKRNGITKIRDNFLEIEKEVARIREYATYKF